jgi:hypothetical protein
MLRAAGGYLLAKKNGAAIAQHCEVAELVAGISLRDRVCAEW